MRKKGNRTLLEDLRSMFGDRAIFLALLFSLAVHGALMLALEEWPATKKSGKPAMIVARLVRHSGRLQPQERGKGEKETNSGRESAGTVSPMERPGETRPQDAAEGRGSERSLAAPGLSGAAGTVVSAGAWIGEGSLPRVGAILPSAPPVHAPARGVISLPSKASGRPIRRGNADDALAEIRRRIESKKRYPMLARRNGWEGKVLVEIRLGGGGELQGVRLLQPSGIPLLDRATVKAVESAVPFPPLPGTVRIPVTYDLED